MIQRKSQKRLLGVLLISAAALVAYWPALSGKFLWDDDALVAHNRLVHDPGGLVRIWFSADAIDYWPVTNSAFWLEWRLWGENTVGYHVVNLALHVANALLIWLILRRLTIPGAFLAALLFAVHPVNVESVAWIAQLKNLLAMFFALLAVRCFLKHKAAPFLHKAADGIGGGAPIDEDNHLAASRGYHPRLYGIHFYCFSVFLFLLAMLSKGSVAIVPILLLLVIWWQQRKITRRDIFETVPFWLIAIGLTAVNVWYQTHGTAEVIRTASFAQRLAGAGAAIWFYLAKAIAPIHLNFVYPQRHIDAASALWWLPLIATLVVTMALWWKRQTTWGRPLLFAWLAFFAALIPVLGFADIYFMRFSLVADHYQYIALIAVVAPAAAFISSPPSAFRLPPSIGWIGSLIIVAALCSTSWEQCRIYRNPTTLWQSVLDKNPDCPLAHTNLGRELQKAGRLSEAIAHFQSAIQTDPNFAEAHCGLGSTLAAFGKHDEALAECQRAVELQPTNSQAQNDLASLLLRDGRAVEAIDHCQAALQSNPDYAEAHNNLGIAYSRLDQLDKALPHFRLALRLAPDDAEIHNNLANALVKTHHLAEAIAEYQQALRLKPGYLSARCNLALAYDQAHQPAAALTAAQQALELADSTGQAAQSQKLRAWLSTYRASHPQHLDTAVQPAAFPQR